MRPEAYPLDLNNLPDENAGKVSEDSSPISHRKKKCTAKDGKDESGKVYECRFCSLKFCKSQALGGHMNRHRQERETETLNKARQLVFGNDNLAGPAAPNLGCCHPITPVNYHPVGSHGDPSIPLRFPARMFSGSSSSTILPPASQQSYFYNSPPRAVSSFPSFLPPQNSINDFHFNQFPHHQNLNYASDAKYTCIGAPVGLGFGSAPVGPVSDMSGTAGREGGREGYQEEGLSWGQSYAAGTQQRLDLHSSINRFQDGI